jgi:2-keto-4-pentenoate hydratase
MASAEPEIAFRLATDLPAGGRPHTRDSVLGAVASVHPAIEIPDSRFRDAAAVGEAQLVADVACAAYVVLGEPMTNWALTDLQSRHVQLLRNGDVVSTGSGANALGDPCEALLWLVNEVNRHGSDLHAGDIVITGAAAPPQPIQVGDTVTAIVEGAAPLSVSICGPSR